MKLQTGGGNLLVAVDIYITNFKSIKAPNIENDSQTPQNSNPQNPQNLNTSQSSTSQNLAPQTPSFQTEAQEAGFALDSVINSTIDSATQSAQNTQNLQQSQNLQMPQMQNSTISQTLTNIKIKVFIFMGICVVSAFINTFSKLFLSGFLLFIAICVYIGAYCVLYSAMESLWKRAKSKILKDSVVSYIVASIIGWGGLFLFSALAKVGSRASDNNGFLIALFCLLILSFLVYSIILRYRIYKEVAYITNQPLFLVAFWLVVTILLSPIAVIVYIVAWIMVKKIRQSASTGEYK